MTCGKATTKNRSGSGPRVWIDCAHEDQQPPDQRLLLGRSLQHDGALLREPSGSHLAWPALSLWAPGRCASRGTRVYVPFQIQLEGEAPWGWAVSEHTPGYWGGRVTVRTHWPVCTAPGALHTQLVAPSQPPQGRLSEEPLATQQTQVPMSTHQAALTGHRAPLPSEKAWLASTCKYKPAGGRVPCACRWRKHLINCGRGQTGQATAARGQEHGQATPLRTELEVTPGRQQIATLLCAGQGLARADHPRGLACECGSRSGRGAQSGPERDSYKEYNLVPSSENRRPSPRSSPQSRGPGRPTGGAAKERGAPGEKAAGREAAVPRLRSRRHPALCPESDLGHSVRPL